MRFDRRDRVFIALCLLTIVAGAAVFRAGFSRAFPEASIDFKVTREEAVRRGAEALRARGFSLDGACAPSSIFDGDDEAKVYLERTLGLEKANPIFATTVPVWRWSVRWVRPLEKLEYRAAVSPDGRLLAIRRILPEKDAAPDPGEAAARALAEAEIRTLRGLDPAGLRFIETTTEKRPGARGPHVRLGVEHDPLRGRRAPLPRRGAGGPRRALVAPFRGPGEVAPRLRDAPLEEPRGGHGRHAGPSPHGARRRSSSFSSASAART